jgi:hypothetical protein
MIEGLTTIGFGAFFAFLIGTGITILRRRADPRECHLGSASLFRRSTTARTSRQARSELLDAATPPNCPRAERNPRQDAYGCPRPSNKRLTRRISAELVHGARKIRRDEPKLSAHLGDGPA